MRELIAELYNSYKTTISAKGGFKKTIRQSHRLKMIFIIALPVIVQNIVAHIQILIDRMFLGHLDSRFLSVLGNVMVPYNASGIFLIAVSTGLSVLVAQNIGAKKLTQARDYTESTFLYATILSGLIGLFWLTSAPLIFRTLGIQGEMNIESSIYVRIISLSLFFAGVEVTSAAVLSASGYTTPVMISGLIKNGINIILDYIMIFGHFGCPAMGLEGAAWATVISNAIGAFYLVAITLTTKKLPFTFSLKSLLQPAWKHFHATMKIGLPAGFETLLWFVGQLYLVRLVNGISPTTIGVLSLVISINHFALFVYAGFSRSALTLVGQYTGSGNKDGALKAAFECFLCGLSVSIIWSAFLLIFPEFFIKIFTTDLAVIKESVNILKLSVLFMIFQVPNIIIGNSLRGTGDTKWMLYTQIFGTIFVILAAQISVSVFKIGLYGIFITLALDEAIRGFINMWRFFVHSRNKKLAIITLPDVVV